MSSITNEPQLTMGVCKFNNMKDNQSIIIRFSILDRQLWIVFWVSILGALSILLTDITWINLLFSRELQNDSIVLLLLTAIGLLILTIPYIPYFMSYRSYKAWKYHQHIFDNLSHSVCPYCKYDLQGQSPRVDGCIVCPECGVSWSKTRKCYYQDRSKKVIVLLLTMKYMPILPVVHLYIYIIILLLPLEEQLIIFRSVPFVLLFGIFAGAPMMWKYLRDSKQHLS